MDHNLSSLSSNWSTVAAGVGVGIVVGWLLRTKLHKSLAKQSTSMAEQVFSEECLGPECKLVLVVRNDLKMGKGKACAQCSHASVLAYEQVKKQKTLMNLWRLSGQRKVVVKVDDEDELLEIETQARKVGLVTSLIRDAGHTQVKPGSKTCLGVGPGPQQLVDKVTGHLKLY